jgi:hypothetical protein
LYFVASARRKSEFAIVCKPRRPHIRTVSIDAIARFRDLE